MAGGGTTASQGVLRHAMICPGGLGRAGPAWTACAAGVSSKNKTALGILWMLRNEALLIHNLPFRAKGYKYRAEKKSLQNIFKQDPGRTRQSS